MRERAIRIRADQSMEKECGESGSFFADNKAACGSLQRVLQTPASVCLARSLASLACSSASGTQSRDKTCRVLVFWR